MNVWRPKNISGLMRFLEIFHSSFVHLFSNEVHFSSKIKLNNLQKINAFKRRTLNNSMSAVCPNQSLLQDEITNWTSRWINPLEDCLSSYSSAIRAFTASIDVIGLYPRGLQPRVLGPWIIPISTAMSSSWRSWMDSACLASRPAFE